MLLEANNITAHYQKVEVLKNVFLRVREEAIVCVLGANGAGKSTLMRIVSGLKAPSSGEIWFRGGRIDGLEPQSIVELGITHVLEGRRLFPYMTVVQNLKIGGFLRKDKEEVSKDLNRLYERFPLLKQRAKQLAMTLSGGEQQIVAIARALMAKPKLLTLDEPSLGLSPLMIVEIGRIITEINRSRVSILLVEQNANLALRLANEGYVLETGSIILSGDTKKLLNNDIVKKSYIG